MQRANLSILVAAFAIASPLSAIAQTTGTAATAQPSPAPAPQVLAFPAGVDPQAQALAQKRFLFEQEKAVADALKNLCDTQYGPADDCGIRKSTTNAGGPSGAAGKGEQIAVSQTPRFIERSLWGTSHQATLLYPDGHTENLTEGGKPGSDDYRAVLIERASLTLEHGGKRMTVPLESRGEASGHAALPAMLPAQLPPLQPLPAAPQQTQAPQPAAPKNTSMFQIDAPIPPPAKKQTPQEVITLPEPPPQ